MNLSVTLTPNIWLDQAWKEAGVEDPATVTKLTVAGTMKPVDFWCIRKYMHKTLKELDMGGVLDSIISEAFYDCSGLISVTIPAATTIIENNAFSGCSSLASITFPDFVDDSNDFISFTVPPLVTEIGNFAFNGCSALKSVYIHESVKFIGNYAFENCPARFTVHPNNPMYRSIDGKLEYSEEHLKLIAWEEEEEISREIRRKIRRKDQRSELIKQERIRKMQINSAEEWVKSLMTNSNYLYKIVKGHENKLLLHVKIDGQQHLEIPIYYKSFQKIVPKLMETILKYENFIKNSQIRALVKNSLPNDHEWLNNSE